MHVHTCMLHTVTLHFVSFSTRPFLIYGEVGTADLTSRDSVEGQAQVWDLLSRGFLGSVARKHLWVNNC